MVAVDHSLATTRPYPLPKNVFLLNDHTLGIVFGKLEDQIRDFLLRELRTQMINGILSDDSTEWRTCLEVASEMMARYLTGCNQKEDLTGGVVVGWDEMGPGLYGMDGEGKLSEENFLAFGSRSRCATVRDIDRYNTFFMYPLEYASSRGKTWINTCKPRTRALALSSSSSELYAPLSSTHTPPSP
ncbi:OLC1v1007026C1 [Oldenlandia corymbosa var. corymbosa]|uniref:OLC1v1007026C1 n=1 Tax=Oldenlandia corymbosa var. corymbosa TaxID=529605 RepID=A0AAV1DJ06_OLDCO|nr:OLC1v1007026C1 [Oldenlandia corymbosa var. corymbosa]